MPLRLVSWNMSHNRGPNAWARLTSDPQLDVALLQEACVPPTGVARQVVPTPDSAKWLTAGNKPTAWRTAIVRLRDGVALHPRKLVPVGRWAKGAVPVSRKGTLAVADIAFGAEPITLVSAYAVWETPSPKRSWIIADASAHRLISDVSSLISTQRDHRIIVAGDFNIYRGEGDHGSVYWKQRYATVFDRMEAIGLPLVGPFGSVDPAAAPGRVAAPRDRPNVPTYRTKRDEARTATHQLDFVFASQSLHSRLKVRALDGDDEWGPSDHCRVQIDLADAKPRASSAAPTRRSS